MTSFFNSYYVTFKRNSCHLVVLDGDRCRDICAVTARCNLNTRPVCVADVKLNGKCSTKNTNNASPIVSFQVDHG